jgi:hypothetical protein
MLVMCLLLVIQLQVCYKESALAHRCDQLGASDMQTSQQSIVSSQYTLGVTQGC